MALSLSLGRAPLEVLQALKSRLCLLRQFLKISSKFDYISIPFAMLSLLPYMQYKSKKDRPFLGVSLHSRQPSPLV